MAIVLFADYNHKKDYLNRLEDKLSNLKPKAESIQNKIVKIIVKKKTDNKLYERFIDKLYSSGVAELKVVENHDFSGWYDDKERENYESEDTLSILNRFVQESEIDLDKSKIQSIISSIYQEACEIV